MKKKILIIDDEERIRKIYARLFQAIGSGIFEVLEAENAEKATDYLIREKLDLVLLDIKMPDIDGTRMYEIIREYNPNLEVVVASVYPVEEQKRLLPYASAYYDKSEGPIKLLEKVSSTLVSQD